MRKLTIQLPSEEIVEVMVDETTYKLAAVDKGIFTLIIFIYYILLYAVFVEYGTKENNTTVPVI